MVTTLKGQGLTSLKFQPTLFDDFDGTVTPKPETVISKHQQLAIYCIEAVIKHAKEKDASSETFPNRLSKLNSEVITDPAGVIKTIGHSFTSIAAISTSRPLKSEWILLPGGKPNLFHAFVILVSSFNAEESFSGVLQWSDTGSRTAENNSIKAFKAGIEKIDVFEAGESSLCDFFHEFVYRVQFRTLKRVTQKPSKQMITDWYNNQTLTPDNPPSHSPITESP